MECTLPVLTATVGMNEEDAPILFRMCSLDSNGTMTWQEFKVLHDRMITEARRPDKHDAGHHSYKELKGEIRRTPAAKEHELTQKYHKLPRGTHPVNWDAMHALYKAFDQDNDDYLTKQEVFWVGYLRPSYSLLINGARR
jgi:hypothetical protein